MPGLAPGRVLPVGVADPGGGCFPVAGGAPFPGILDVAAGGGSCFTSTLAVPGTGFPPTGVLPPIACPN